MRRRSDWRDRADAVIGPILRQAIAERWTEGYFTGKLRYAYPFGARANHPYDIWRDCQEKAIARFRVMTSGGIRLRGPVPEDDRPLNVFPLFAGIERTE